jgi:hypothetical protein
MTSLFYAEKSRILGLWSYWNYLKLYSRACSILSFNLRSIFFNEDFLDVTTLFFDEAAGIAGTTVAY